MASFMPVSEDMLLKAFQVTRSPPVAGRQIRRLPKGWGHSQALDPENKGVMTDETLEKFLVNSGTGEPFTAAEFEEMLSAARDPDSGLIHYAEHALLMALDPDLLA